MVVLPAPERPVGDRKVRFSFEARRVTMTRVTPGALAMKLLLPETALWKERGREV